MRQFINRYFAICTAILLLLIALPSNAQPTTPQLPDTPAAKVFSAWLAAFNTADVAQFKAFDEKYNPKPPMVEDVDFRKMTGGFTVVRVESSEPTKLVVLMKEKASENMGRIELTVSAESQPKILNLEIRLVPAAPPQRSGPGGPGGPGGPAPVARLTQEETITATNKRVDELVATDQFSGALLVAQNGKPVFTRAVGMQDRENNVPNTLNTKFRIGSMNKMFTAVAALQLVESGKLSLDDTVGKHLLDYPNREVASKVTVRHLLTHTGGTGDIFGPEFEQNRLSLKTPSDYVKLYGNRAPMFEPGSDHRYSNYGYILLGAMIEKASGLSYDDYVQKSIFAAAGMTDTGAMPESQPVANRAVGYMRPQGKWVPNTPTLPWSGSPAGGGYSTVGDMMRFAVALESGKLLSKPMFINATTPQQKSYGFGFGVRGGMQRTAYGHGGGAPGINGKLLIIPAQGYVVVALSNLDPPAADQLVDFIADRLPLNTVTGATTNAAMPSIERTEVPMNAQAKRPAIMARVNGGEPIEITYDTGAQGPVIAKSLADKLGLQVIGEALIGSPEGGKPVPVKLVSLGQLTIGGFAARTREAVVLDDARMPKGSTIVIGNNEFPDARIELDFATATLRLSKSTGAGTADWSPLSDRGFPAGTMQIGSESIPLHVDSGNPGWLTIPKTFAARLPLTGPLIEAPAMHLVDKVITRVSAPMDTTARIGNTQIALRGPFMFADLRYANLGSAALKTASLVIDMPSRKWTLIFKTNDTVPVIAPPALIERAGALTPA